MCPSQAAMKGIRRSPSEAAEIVRSLVPQRQLMSVLLAVAHSVRVAHEAAPSKWGLRLNRDSVMLKVGFPEVLQLRKGWFHVLAFGESIPAGLRNDKRLLIGNPPYKSAKGCDTCDMKTSDVAKIYPALQSAHEEAIRIAARSQRRLDTPRDHSPGLIVFISRELRVSVPQPHYLDSPTEELPTIPEEIPGNQEFEEGAVTQVLVDRYERDRAAREACIRRYGTACSVCGDILAEKYGVEVEGLIHVHHLTPLSSIQGPRSTNVHRDLRPVCPNCHAVIHSVRPPRSIDEVKKMVRKTRGV
jgi:hypothetical protein